MFEQYRLGEFYYLPWSDPLVREQFKHAIPSKVPKEKTVDWNPDDLLYIPLRLPDGQVVGIMSIDDPIDGRCPTKESLAPLELFAHQAAVAVENARLIQNLNEENQVVFRYCDDKGKDLDEFPVNVNGSTESIAGICNPEGNVLGMMPHPERAFFSWQLPPGDSRKYVAETGPGKLIFESMKRYIEVNS